MNCRCVLLFARSPSAEARRKGLAGAEAVFALAAERVADAAAAGAFDLLVVGEADPRPGARHLPQRGRGFGERLRNAVADARALGYGAIVVVPGDVPGLDRARLAEAGAALAEGRMVLGPSPDGGVYLLGLPAGVAPEEIGGVRWQTASVFDDLSGGDGGRPHVLSPLPDLDRPRDLEPLAVASAQDPRLLALLRSLRSRARLTQLPPTPRAQTLLRALAEPLRGPPLAA